MGPDSFPVKKSTSPKVRSNRTTPVYPSLVDVKGNSGAQSFVQFASISSSVVLVVFDLVLNGADTGSRFHPHSVVFQRLALHYTDYLPCVPVHQTANA
jgi:hypothetical protein